VTPGRVLVWPAALAGGAGERVPLGLTVQVGDSGLGDLVADGGVHHGLPVTWLDLSAASIARRTAVVSRPADTVAVSLLTAGWQPGVRASPAGGRVMAGGARPEESAMSVDAIGVLRQTELLRSVPATDLQAVAAASRLRVFRRGQVVFTTGDPDDTLVVVVSGRVKVVVRSADGAELTLTMIGPGGTLGELSVADGGPRSADAEALEQCQLLLIPRETIQQVCTHVPAAAQALTTAIAATVRRLTEAVSDLVFMDLPRRVAKVLVGQAADADGVIRLELRQEELAHQVGATRQSVNATLRGFQNGAGSQCTTGR
jgi:CRP/FNR family transcriptional regulator, cyclic AMP receptor protein